jgi:hypothetical protein
MLAVINQMTVIMKTWSICLSTTKELAAIYKVSERIMRNYIKRFAKEIGPRVGYYWTINQVEMIIRLLGPPPDIKVIYPNEQ